MNVISQVEAEIVQRFSPEHVKAVIRAREGEDLMRGDFERLAEVIDYFMSADQRCTCKAEHWEVHTVDCPLAVRNRQVTEVEQLRQLVQSYEAALRGEQGVTLQDGTVWIGQPFVAQPVATLTSKDEVYRRMMDDVLSWSRAGYPGVACGRYKDAAELIRKQAGEIERLQRDLADCTASHQRQNKYVEELENKLPDETSGDSRDAARYRFIKAGLDTDDVEGLSFAIGNLLNNIPVEEWDACIDRELAKSPLKAKDDLGAQSAADGWLGIPGTPEKTNDGPSHYVDDETGRVHPRVTTSTNEPHQHGGPPMTLRECMEAEEPSSSRIDRQRFEKAPCYLCGYSGEGYFQPGIHRCAAQYHGYELAESPRPGSQS